MKKMLFLYIFCALLGASLTGCTAVQNTAAVQNTKAAETAAAENAAAENAAGVQNTSAATPTTAPAETDFPTPANALPPNAAQGADDGGADAATATPDVRAGPTPTRTPTKVFIFNAAPTATFRPSPVPPAGAVYRLNARLGRGVNLGNALEAPKEGDWGVKLQADYFPLIRKAGFDHVRVPIRFSAHAAAAPYALDPTFMARIDWVVQQALDNDLAVILDFHGFDEIMQNPDAQAERFTAIWAQLAERYQNAPDTVYFELLNEPSANLISGTWKQLVLDALAVIRKSNPARAVIVGPAGWYAVGNLPTLSLPEDDRALIVSVHFYDPFHFTHQGAEWAEGSNAWLGTQWQGVYTDTIQITSALDDAARWAAEQDRPLYLGEFGAYSKADMDSRARWTNYVARTAESLGMSWAYWEFCAGFGVYDPDAKAWRAPLLTALLGSR